MLFTLLIFKIKRIILVKNGLTMLLNFCFEMPNIWVGRMMLNNEKKGDGLNKESQRHYFSVFFTIWAVMMPTYIDQNIKESHILLAKT